MITLTRRNGTRFALNPDLVERVEATPDTVVTLVGGTHYVVVETVEDVVDEVRSFRASVLAEAGIGLGPDAGGRPALRAVTDLET